MEEWLVLKAVSDKCRQINSKHYSEQFRNCDSVISTLTNVLGSPILNARFSLPKRISSSYDPRHGI